MASANDLFETLKRWLQGDSAASDGPKPGEGQQKGASTGGQSNASSKASAPFLKEKLERDADAQAAYRRWIERELSTSLEVLRVQFGPAANKGTDAAESGFLRHEGQTTRGLLIEQPEQHFGPGAGAHLLDWCADRIQGMAYYRQHAEVRVWVRDEGLERLERIHLKPRFLYNEEARISDQRYGNVTLEHRLWNDRSVNWKLINNIYHDRAWSQALPFGELVEQLLLHPG